MMRAGWMVAVAVVAGLAGAAVAQGNAKTVIETRQAGFKSMGGAFKGIRDQVTGGSPDAAAVQKHAAAIAAVAPKVASWFPKGTGPEAGIKTEASPDIWTNPDGFKKAAANLDVQAKAMLAAANSGDMAAVGAQMKALGGACGGCHKPFRIEDK